MVWRKLCMPRRFFSRGMWACFIGVDQLIEMIALGKREKWCHMPHKHLVGTHHGSAVLQVIDDGPAPLGDEREFQRLSGLGLNKGQCFVCPVKVG